MTKERLDFGRKGEKAAEAYLRKRGYRILQKNFRTNIGEIDLIAEHNNALVFIEVKTRSDLQFGHPSSAVTPAKQIKIAQTAQTFLVKHPVEGKDIRFDVVSVTPCVEDPRQMQVELIQDAFRV